jgi:protein involved in polysaccharide export with SLBB domain
MKTLFFSGLTAVLLALIAGCASRSAQFGPVPAPSSSPATGIAAAPLADQSAPALPQPENKPFALGPGDTIDVEILGTPASHAPVTVGLDGKIYYQLLPGLDVWGLTLAQTRDLLERQLGKYLNSAQVDVSLRTVGSKHIWLLGRLSRPGIYPVTGPMSLLEAFALAGGTSSPALGSTEDLADLRHSFVMRQGQLLPVDFARLLREGDMTQNVQLQADDFVYVPSALAQEVYVLGSVRAPRAVVYTDQMTLVSAISAVNGPVKYDYLSSYYQGHTPDAYMSHVAIVRGSLAQPQVAVVDYNAIVKGRAPDVRLEPGDIIYVPDSPFRTLKTYVNMIVNAFVTTVAANEGVRAGGSSGTVGVSVPVGGR